MAAKGIILVDFDNIFLGLWAFDRRLALQFAGHPDWLLEGLSQRYLIDEPRRWLVARCYLNPAGYVADGYKDDGTENRRYFSRIRPLWVSAGFEVIDTPTLARDKNAADIRIVIDALDLMQHPVRYDEFMIASGDSDFAPLLQRLRAHDRHTIIMTPGNASRGYTSLASRVLDFNAIKDLFEADAPVSPPRPIASSAGEGGEFQARFAEFIGAQVAEANGPLNLAALANLTAQHLPGIRENGWGGAGTFKAALLALSLPHTRISDTHLWDEERHQEPQAVQPTIETSDLPELIELLARTVDLPRLASATWPLLFDAIEEFLGEHEFNLSESTKWVRDVLAERGTQVGRASINFVVRGAQFGGAPLEADPAPAAGEIGSAFMRNLINLAYAAGINIDREDEQEILEWLGIKGDQADREAA